MADHVGAVDSFQGSLRDLDLAVKPERHPSVAELLWADQLLLGSEVLGRTIVLDPISRVLWAGFDGDTTLKSLARDLTRAGIADRSHAQDILLGMARSLIYDGFLVAPEYSRKTNPRSIHPWISPDNCLGRSMGLGRATARQVVVEGTDLRFHSTLPEVFDLLDPDVTTVEVDTSWVETLTLRASRSPTGRARAQRVLDSMGDLVFESRDIGAATASFVATANGMIAACRGGEWLKGDLLVCGDRAVVIDRSLSGLLRDTTTELQLLDIHRAEGRMFRLLVGGELQPASRTVTWSAAAVAVALRNDVLQPNDVRRVTEMLRRWDQPHFDRMGTLLSETPVLGVTAPRPTDFVAHIRRAFER